jgi:uncharacterized cupredoxin-like copper-binding protein
MARIWVAAFLAAMATLAAVPVAASSRPAAVLHADVAEWSIVPSAGVVSAGEVRIVVRNLGEETHAFMVARTHSFAQSLPLRGDHAMAHPVVAAVELEPGETATIRLRLRRGSYVMLDNLPWHYWKGTAVPFAVR